MTLVIFFVIQTFVARPYCVHQQSMERTLEPDQCLLIDKLTPHFGPYDRGDIVVFDPPTGWVTDGDGTPYVKRVIGIGGDAVEVRSDGFVYVNATKLDEPYLFATGGQPQPTTVTGTWHVPDGELFVMGDHREVSADSRLFGPVPVSAVIGRAWLRYLPLATFGVLSRPAYPELSSPAP